MEFTFPLINSKYIEGKAISNDWSLLHIFPFLLIYSQPQCFRTKYLTVKLWFLEPSNFLLSYQLKTCSGIEKILDDYWVERCLEFKHNYSKEVAFEALTRKYWLILHQYEKIMYMYSLTDQNLQYLTLVRWFSKMAGVDDSFENTGETLREGGEIRVFWVPFAQYVEPCIKLLISTKLKSNKGLLSS